MWRAIVESILGDHNKGWQKEMRCPYMLCPSNQPEVGAKVPRMKFLQKIQPRVYQYRCQDCGCLTNVSVEVDNQGQESWRINPSLIGGQPGFHGRWKW